MIDTGISTVVTTATTTPSPAPKPAVTTKPVATPVAKSMATAVNAAVGVTLKPPKGLTLGRTGELKNQVYLHALVYSETSARKTTTAAKFGNKENVRFIITRRKEQLIPLQNMDYQYAEVTDGASLLYAMTYPERLWPDWALLPERTLIVDDVTEAVALLLEDHDEEKDKRRSYSMAGDDLRDSTRSLLRKPMNLIFVCLARVKDSPLSNEERISPDLPPSMMNMILAEFEFVFYIHPEQYKFITDKDFFAYTGPDPSNPSKMKTFKRQIFAKCKTSEELARAVPPLVNKNEALDLRAIWERVRAGEKAVVSAK
jgi:hypothetical protein